MKNKLFKILLLIFVFIGSVSLITTVAYTTYQAKQNTKAEAASNKRLFVCNDDQQTTKTH